MDVNTDGGSGGTRGQEAHDDYQFYYDHASGRHILHRPDQRPRPPRYSFKCILCNLIDVMIVIGCIAFLYFAITFALDLLDEEGEHINMTTKCPICGASPVLDETCPAACGSLEGILQSDVDRASRTFGFDWGEGFVAPFLGIDHQTAKDALLAAQVSEGDTVVDLGCGDGRVCIAACLLGADATGYDLDKNLITQAKSLADEMEVSISGKRPKFDVKDLFEVELDQFSVICTFLLPETMDRLVPSLLAELTKGSRIISFGWNVRGLGEPSACCRGKADSTATERWFLYTREE